MALSHATHWIIAFPLGSSTAERTQERLASSIVEAAGRPICDIDVFNVPVGSFRTGTLDALMTLSDDLARADAVVESAVRRAERIVGETHVTAESNDYTAKKGVAPPAGAIPALGMRAGGKPVHEYLRHWAWAGEQFDVREALPDLARRLVSTAEKLDADLRALAAGYQEKRTSLQAAERKKGGNLMVAGLEDVITPAALAEKGAEWIPASSEFLQSVAVVLPAAAEESFLESYAQLDGRAVPVGPEHARETVRTSPVVPGSAVKLAADKDGYVLYCLVVLKRFGDSFRAACRERRYAVREFELKPELAGSGAATVSRLQAETSAALRELVAESRRAFSRLVIVWMHLKSVRVYTDAVLRYGLPVNFCAFLLRPQRESVAAADVKRALEGVQAAWRAQAGGATAFDAMYGGLAEGAAKSEAGIPGVTDGSGAGGVGSSLPFVFHDLELKKEAAGK